MLWASRRLRRRSGEVGLHPRRGADERLPRPRPGDQRRDGARRERQGAGRAHPRARSRSAPTRPAPRWPVVFYGLRLTTGPYDIGAMHAVADAVFTNTTPLVPYRGAGRPEAAYLIERLMDEAALQIGMDPVELRRRNFIKPEQMPYHTQTHYVYNSGEFEEAMDKCLELADWAGFAARKAQSEQAGKLRGRGLRLLHRGGRHLQRAHGPALRSRGQRHDPRRHPFARAGPRDGVRADGHGVAGHPVREHPLSAGRHREGRDRPRHLRLAQRDERRLRAEGRGRRRRSPRAARWRRS